MQGISKRQIGRLCAELDKKVEGFCTRKGPDPCQTAGIPYSRPTMAACDIAPPLSTTTAAAGEHVRWHHLPARALQEHLRAGAQRCYHRHIWHPARPAELPYRQCHQRQQICHQQQRFDGPHLASPTDMPAS
jgi:hypothetical protein